MGGGVDHKRQLGKAATENHIYSLPFTLHLCTHLCIVMLDLSLYVYLLKFLFLTLVWNFLRFVLIFCNIITD